jgi:hypothetical protein
MRHQQGVPLEQVAANLRRLRGVLTVDAHRSAAHQMGNRLAYDQVLIQACEMLPNTPSAMPSQYLRRSI